MWKETRRLNGYSLVTAMGIVCQNLSDKLEFFFFIDCQKRKFHAVSRIKISATRTVTQIGHAFGWELLLNPIALDHMCVYFSFCRQRCIESCPVRSRTSKIKKRRLDQPDL